MAISLNQFRNLMGNDGAFIHDTYMLSIEDNDVSGIIVETHRDMDMYQDQCFYSFVLNGKLYEGKVGIDDWEVKNSDNIYNLVHRTLSDAIAETLIKRLGKVMTESQIYTRGAAIKRPPTAALPTPEEKAEITYLSLCED